MNIVHVKTVASLDKCIENISKYSSIGLDLEFDKNLHRHGFNICLIQIQAGDQSYLIDPLSKEMDYKLIFSILENPEIEKIVFAFGEDLRLLNSLSCYPKNIYDLNNATKILNYEPGSLGKYLLDVLGVEVGKSAQLSNWFTRPLKEEQARYAAEDVIYLLELKTALEKELEEKGISEWVRQENEQFDNIRYEIDYDNVYLKSKDKKGLTEFQWDLLKKLLQFREEEARKMDRPSFKVMDVNFLKDFVHDTDRIDSWKMDHGLSRSLRNKGTKSKFKALLQESEKAFSEGTISKTKWANAKNDGSDYKNHQRKKKRLEQQKVVVFKPIQSLIKRDYGEDAATFILSNKIMQKIVFCQMDDCDDYDMLPYKVELFLNYAKELGIQLTDYSFERT